MKSPCESAAHIDVPPVHFSKSLANRPRNALSDLVNTRRGSHEKPARTCSSSMRHKRPATNSSVGCTLGSAAWYSSDDEVDARNEIWSAVLNVGGGLGRLCVEMSVRPSGEDETGKAEPREGDEEGVVGE